MVLARKAGEFRRDNPFLERGGDRTCPTCAWTVALTLGRVDQEVQSEPSSGGGGELLRLGLRDGQPAKCKPKKCDAENVA